MSTAHVVCRSVRDCAVMLDCTAGAAFVHYPADMQVDFGRSQNSI
jgi:hypothetical protein